MSIAVVVRDRRLFFMSNEELQELKEQIKQEILSVRGYYTFYIAFYFIFIFVW